MKSEQDKTNNQIGKKKPKKKGQEAETRVHTFRNPIQAQTQKI